MKRGFPFLAVTALRSALFDMLFFAWGLFSSLLGLLMLLIPGRRALRNSAALWARGVTLLERMVLGLSYVMRGRENLPKPPYIVAVQHQSAWETPKLLYWFDDAAVVMKEELLALPLWGACARRHGSIGVSRSGKPEDLHRFIAAAKARAAEGRPIILFPQGTRTPPGSAGKLQRGVAVLHEELGVPIVPVTLNSGNFWPRKAFLKYPGTVTVTVHPPLKQGLTRDEVMQALRRIFES